MTELRTLAKTSEFTDSDAEILQQLIQHCKSTRLRRRALREADKSLSDILTIGKTLEQSDEQATFMEKDKEVVNKVKIKMLSTNHVTTNKTLTKAITHGILRIIRVRKYAETVVVNIPINLNVLLKGNLVITARNRIIMQKYAEKKH